MNKVIEIFVDTIIIWISAFLSGKVLFRNNNKNHLINILIIILFSFVLTCLNAVNSEIYYGIFKILCSYILMVLFYLSLFNKNISKCCIAGLLLYLSLSISEVVTVIISSMILELLNSSISLMKYNILLNFIIYLCSHILIRAFKSKFRNIIDNNNSKISGNIFIIIVVLLTIALLIYRIPLSDWEIDAEFIITMSILLSFILISLYLFKQRSDIQKASSKYQEVVKYSNTTNKLLEDYRMINHEHKNQLSIIRQMINKNSKELNEYIDNLIEKRNDIKYKWVADLNNIPDEGLKGLINYKLIGAEDSKINITVIISKEVSKIKLNKLNTREKDELYSIIGVYLDNAIQAAKESKDKEISLEIYKDRKDIIFVLGNTFKGNIDINKIDNYGYSTKGKNHGVGLHIVKNILNDNNLFSQNREILDNYYIQHLVIHTNNIKNNKKKK